MFSKTKISQKMILFILSWLCLSASITSGFDITHILGQHPELSTFSNYLTQTNLAQEINSRQTITVLAVANSDMGPLSGKPMDEIKKILSVHVFLDYYDMNKLKSIQGNNPLTVTTLLQASGQALAMNNQGFINVTASSGSVGFGSAATGVARQTQAQLVKSVMADPYSISVLQISSPIIPSGINGGSSNGSTTPQKSLNADSPTQAPTQPPTQSPKPDDHAPTQSPPQGDNAPTQSPISQPPMVSPPSDQSRSNSPSPNQSPPSESSAPGSSQQQNAPSPSGNTPSPSDAEAPQSSEADAPTNDDSPSSSNSPNGDSPSSSSSPTDNSPSMAPGSEASADVPTSADDEGKKKKNAAGGVIAPYSVASWICTIILSLILGNQF